LVLGAQFEFSAVSSLRREIIFGTIARTLVVPLLGIGVAFLFFRNVFEGAHFAAFVAMFCTPVAVSSVPMAQEMKGDAALAGQLVVWTTLASALSVFIASWLLKLAGVF
jgi:predicted permease